MSLCHWNCASSLGLVLPTQAHGWALRAGCGCPGWQRLRGTRAPGQNKTTAGGRMEGHLQAPVGLAFAQQLWCYQQVGLQGLRGSGWAWRWDQWSHTLEDRGPSTWWLWDCAIYSASGPQSLPQLSYRFKMRRGRRDSSLFFFEEYWGHIVSKNLGCWFNMEYFFWFVFFLIHKVLWKDIITLYFLM